MYLLIHYQSIYSLITRSPITAIAVFTFWVLSWSHDRTNFIIMGPRHKIFCCG